MFCESRQDWFGFIVMYKSKIPCVNVMNKIQWEGIKQCVIFGRTSIFIWSSESFQYCQAVTHLYGGTSWSLDSFIPDAVDPFNHGFFGLTPHGTANVCLPEEGCELWYVFSCV